MLYYTMYQIHIVVLVVEYGVLLQFFIVATSLLSVAQTIVLTGDAPSVMHRKLCMARSIPHARRSNGLDSRHKRSLCSGWSRLAGLAQLVAMMHHAVVQLSRTSTTSTQPVLLHKCMHIDPATTIHRRSFVQRFSQILSELCAYYNTTTMASSA